MTPGGAGEVVEQRMDSQESIGHYASASDGEHLVVSLTAMLFFMIRL
jgi:hypothetical protein